MMNLYIVQMELMEGFNVETPVNEIFICFDFNFNEFCINDSRWFHKFKFSGMISIWNDPYISLQQWKLKIDIEA